MINANTAVAPPTSAFKKWAKRLAKLLAVGVASLVLIGIVVHLIWVSSGNGEWKLIMEKNGIKTYSKKMPGSSLLQFRGLTTIKTTLTRAVAAAADTDLETCQDWTGPACVSGKPVGPWNAADHSFTYLFRYDFPAPFMPREILVTTRFSQDPKSQSVLIEFTARPDLLPSDPCCFRVQLVKNSWRYTPKPGGLVDVDYQESTNVGVPYVMYNLGHPNDIYGLLTDLPRLLNKQKYDNTRFDFITEPGTN